MDKQLLIGGANFAPVQTLVTTKFILTFRHPVRPGLLRVERRLPVGHRRLSTEVDSSNVGRRWTRRDARLSVHVVCDGTRAGAYPINNFTSLTILRV